MSFKVGIVGAGNISRIHAEAVKALPECEQVGVVDIDPARAAAAAEEMGTPAFSSLAAIVDAGADVVHVCTPPRTHAAIAIEALERGCHVLVEKPLAEDVNDCASIREAATAASRVATVNHSLLYDPQFRRALEAVRGGAIGRVVGVDILRGSDYPPFEGGPRPPHYREAGYPFRDLGVHGLYLIQELLGPIEGIDARWMSLGGDPNLTFDEWRTVVRCRDGLASFLLTYNAKPIQHQIIIHGTNGMLRVDLFAMFQSRRATLPLPGAALRLVNAMTDSVRPLLEMPRSVLGVALGRLRSYQGVRDLIRDFYARLSAGDPPPVSLGEAEQIVRWVEEVARAADADASSRAEARAASRRSEVPVLVTGASGRLGGAIVSKLAERGLHVRRFQRRDPGPPPSSGEVFLGDLGDPEAVSSAIRGCRAVIHVGAAMRGGPVEHDTATVQGTRNVLEACAEHGVGKLVHISSMSVVDWAGSSGGPAVTEDSPLEPRPGERGVYTRAKLEAEQLVTRYSHDRGVPAVILRPGQIFGGGIPLVTGAVARRAAGRWLVLGDGRLPLPLVYVDDVADAVLAALDSELRDGEVVQIIDPDVMTQNDVLDVAGEGLPVTHIPRPIVFLAGWMSQPAFRLLGRQSPVAIYRLRSALARLSFRSDRAQRLLGWTPAVGVREGIRRVGRA